jgi:hypothetical protein
MRRPFAAAPALAAVIALAGCAADPAEDAFKVTATDVSRPDAAATGSAPAPEPSPAEVFERRLAALSKKNGLAITPENATIAFVGSKVTGQHDGGFKSFRGGAGLVASAAEMADFDPDADAPDRKAGAPLVLGELAVEIDMTSVWSDDDRLTEHLRSADFFDVERFSRAYFVGGSAGRDPDESRVMIAGNLTLHGVTKHVEFPAEVEVNGRALTLSTEFAFNRKDFGITYPGHADDLIRDEVVVRIEVHADEPE